MKKIAIILQIALAAFFAPAAFADRVLLKTPVTFDAHLPGLGSPIKFISERLDKISGGEIKMRFYEPGELVEPLEILDAVSSGKVNSGYAVAGYWADKIPAAHLFTGVPFGPEAPEYMAWLYYGNGRALWQKMYDQHGYNVKTMPCAIISPETSGWFKEKITSPSQFKDINIRAFGLGGKVMEKMGANTSFLWGEEVFDALKKGELDAAEFSMPVIDLQLGFHKIVKHNYFPGWHQQATIFELMINKDVWDGMTDQQRAIVETVCQASMTNSLAEAESVQPAALRTQTTENGVSLEYWSPEMLDAFREAWEDVLAEQKKDAFFGEVWDDMSSFRKDYDIWEKKAFLPR